MKNNKIIAIVKFNNGEALVLQNKPQLKYTKYGDDTIVGTDGTFYSFYGRERFSEKWKAFAGRKFDLALTDGGVEKCYGQWWDTVTDRAKKELGIYKGGNEVVYATANSVDSLKSCYVFVGYNTLKHKLDEIRKTYTGKVYDYWDYKKILKAN